jgi:hypothetical protein
LKLRILFVKTHKELLDLIHVRQLEYRDYPIQILEKYSANWRFIKWEVQSVRYTKKNEEHGFAAHNLNKSTVPGRNIRLC